MTRILAAIAFLALALGTIHTGSAQEASPAAERCTIEPVSLKHLQALKASATPVAAVATPLTELPAGEPAGYDNVLAFTKTVQLLVDCINEGHYWRMMAVYSDRYLASILPQLGPLDAANYDPYLTPRPMPAERMMTIAAIGEVVQLPDGRLAGIVTSSLPGQQPIPTLFLLALQAGGWHVDEFFQLPVEAA
jgi:hypothetical protein